MGILCSGSSAAATCGRHVVVAAPFFFLASRGWAARTVSVAVSGSRTRTGSKSRTRPAHPFSTSATTAVEVRGMPRGPRRSTPSSPTIQKMEAMRKGKLGEDESTDYGLLPSTFVRPRKMPSMVLQPRHRAMMEWAWLKTKIVDFAGLLYAYKASHKTKPRPKLGFATRVEDAKALYNEMYSAFARGNIQALCSRLCSGLLADFAHRISLRPRSKRLAWKLLKYTARARVVSDRAVQLPLPETVTGGRAFWMRQCVVRISSEQCLTTTTTGATAGTPGSLPAAAGAGFKSNSQNKPGHHHLRQPTKKRNDPEKKGNGNGNGNGNAAAGEPSTTSTTDTNTHVTTEYLVMQRFLKGAVDEPWKIWGLTNETTLDKWEMEVSKATEMQLANTLKKYESNESKSP